MSGKEHHLSDLKKGLVPSLLIVIIIVVASMAYFFYNPAQQMSTDTFGPISFPQDEGIHSELGETWTLSMQFKTTNGGSYVLSTSYYYQDMVSDINSGREIMFLNTKSGEITRYALHSGISITAAKDRCAYVFTYEDEETGFTFSDTLSRRENSIIYDYHVEVYDGTEKVLDANITLTDQLGKPVLPTDDGRVLIPGQATFYGYFQPRLKVGGEATINGEQTTIDDGSAVFTHFWGAPAASIVGDEFVIGIPTGYTVIAAKYLYAGNGTEAISAVIVINPDGTYYRVEHPVINVTATKYYIAPYDPKQRVVWASQWSLFIPEHDINMTITGVVNDQIASYSWRGFCYANGTFDSSYIESYAFGEITHHYISEINVGEVKLEQHTEVPTDEMRVFCEIEHTLPLKSVKIWYNTSLDGNWTSVLMGQKYPEEFPSYWEGYIPGQKLYTTVNYYVEIVDAAGHVINTPIQTHQVAIEIPS